MRAEMNESWCAAHAATLAQPAKFRNPEPTCHHQTCIAMLEKDDPRVILPEIVGV